MWINLHQSCFFRSKFVLMWVDWGLIKINNLAYLIYRAVGKLHPKVRSARNQDLRSITNFSVPSVISLLWIMHSDWSILVRWLSTPEDQGSNLAISIFYKENLFTINWKDKDNEKGAVHVRSVYFKVNLPNDNKIYFLS